MFFFAFRGPIKYFELAPPELGRSGDGKLHLNILHYKIKAVYQRSVLELRGRFLL